MGISGILFLFPSFVLLSVADDPPQVFFRGSVLNKTSGQTGVKGLEVALYRADGEKPAKPLGQTRTDSSGSFRFEGISADPNTTYFTSTSYKGVQYFSRAVNTGDGMAPPLDIAVYDPTDQDTSVQVKVHHVFLDVRDGNLGIQELLVLENSGKRVYVGSRETQPARRAAMRIPLPEGAFDLKIMTPSLLRTDGGVGTIREIPPGTSKVMFSYAINPANAGYTFSRYIDLKTAVFDLIAPEKGVRLKSGQLELSGPHQLSGKRYYRLSGVNFAGGSRIFVEIGLPRGLGKKLLVRDVIIGLAAFLLITGFVLSFLRIRKNRRTDQADPDPVGGSQVFLERLAELDDLNEAGEIDPETYRQDRERLLKKALELKKIESRNPSRKTEG